MDRVPVLEEVTETRDAHKRRSPFTEITPRAPTEGLDPTLCTFDVLPDQPSFRTHSLCVPPGSVYLFSLTVRSPTPPLFNEVVEEESTHLENSDEDLYLKL